MRGPELDHCHWLRGRRRNQRFRRIFEDILIANCAEIIEPFSIFEQFTGLGVEIGRDSDNGEVDSFLAGSCFDVWNALIDAVIADIRQNNYPVFVKFVLVLLAHLPQEELLGQVEPVNQSVLTIRLNLINFIVDVFIEVLLEDRLEN